MFLQWFCGNSIDDFLESMICSACEGRKVAGLYYQNEIKSMHFFLKKKQRFRKENVIDAIKNVSTLIQQSQIEEIRALYGAECYELVHCIKIAIAIVCHSQKNAVSHMLTPSETLDQD